MKKKASGFYADSLEMLLDTMCNVLGAIIFIALMVALLARDAPPPPREYFQRQAEEMTNELAAVNASNALVEAELQLALVRLHDTSQRLQTNAMRLPNLKQTTKKRWPVVIRYGRLYPLNFLSPGSREGTVPNTRTVDWRRVDRRIASVEPKWGQGDEPGSGVEEEVRAFQLNSKTNYCFAFWVYEDSFAAFNRAKETAAGLGFQYGWKPVAHNFKLNVGEGGEDIEPQN